MVALSSSLGKSGSRMHLHVSVQHVGRAKASHPQETNQLKDKKKSVV